MDKVNPKSLKKGRHVACCVTGSLIGMKIEKDNKNFQVWLNTGLIGRYFLQLKVLVRSNNYLAFAIPEHSSFKINFDEI